MAQVLETYYDRSARLLIFLPLIFLAGSFVLPAEACNLLYIMISATVLTWLLICRFPSKKNQNVAIAVLFFLGMLKATTIGSPTLLVDIILAATVFLLLWAVNVAVKYWANTDLAMDLSGKIAATSIILVGQQPQLLVSLALPLAVSTIYFGAKRVRPSATGFIGFAGVGFVFLFGLSICQQAWLPSLLPIFID